MVRLKRLLVGDQVVEPPGRYAASAKELPRIPFRSGCVDDALAGSQPAADWHASVEPPPFEGEESRDGLAFCQDGNLSARPEAADGHRELRRQEGISQRRRGLLHGVPCGDLRSSQLAWMDERYSHCPV